MAGNGNLWHHTLCDSGSNARRRGDSMPLKVELISSGPDWWNLVPVLVGVAVGFVPSWFLAQRASSQVLERDRILREVNEQAIAFRMHVKIDLLASSILMMRRHVSDGLSKRSIQQFQHMDPCYVVVPMVGFSGGEPVSFEADELSLIYDTGNTFLFEEMVLLGPRNNAVTSSLREYGRLRESMMADIPAPFEFVGLLGSSTLTTEQMANLTKRTVPLNQLILQISAQLDETWRSMKAVAEKFGPAMRTRIKDPKFPSINLLNE